MPKERRTSRNEVVGSFTNGLLTSTHKSARRSSGIESSIAAGGSRSACRHGSGSATKTVTFTQKMPAPSEKSYRRHTAKRKNALKGSKVEVEHRRRDQEAEPDSDDDYVYPREPRSKKESKPGYEGVRRLGRDEEDERRRRAARSKSSHHHHHRYHKHRHQRDRVEEGRPRAHRSQRHQRTPSEQREHDERKTEKRAQRAEREEIEARDLPPSSRTHREKHVEPATRPGFFSSLFKRYS